MIQALITIGTQRARANRCSFDVAGPFIFSLDAVSGVAWVAASPVTRVVRQGSFVRIAFRRSVMIECLVSHRLALFTCSSEAPTTCAWIRFPAFAAERGWGWG